MIIFFTGQLEKRIHLIDLNENFMFFLSSCIIFIYLIYLMRFSVFLSLFYEGGGGGLT